MFLSEYKLTYVNDLSYQQKFRTIFVLKVLLKNPRSTSCALNFSTLTFTWSDFFLTLAVSSTVSHNFRDYFAFAKYFSKII